MNNYIVYIPTNKKVVFPVVAPNRTKALVAFKRKHKIPLNIYAPLNARTPKNKGEEQLFEMRKKVVFYQSPNVDCGIHANGRVIDKGSQWTSLPRKKDATKIKSRRKRVKAGISPNRY